MYKSWRTDIHVIRLKEGNWDRPTRRKDYSHIRFSRFPSPYVMSLFHKVCATGAQLSKIFIVKTGPSRWKRLRGRENRVHVGTISRSKFQKRRSVKRRIYRDRNCSINLRFSEDSLHEPILRLIEDRSALLFIYFSSWFIY